MLPANNPHQHRQQKSEASTQDESTLVDLKSKPIDSANFQCDTESDEYQGLDNDPSFDDASNHSESVQTVPTQLQQQINEEIKPNQEQKKGKNKDDDKTRQTKGKVANNKQYACGKCDQTFSCTSNLKKHQHVHVGQRPFECPLCSKS